MAPLYKAQLTEGLQNAILSLDKFSLDMSKLPTKKETKWWIELGSVLVGIYVVVFGAILFTVKAPEIFHPTSKKSLQVLPTSVNTDIDTYFSPNLNQVAYVMRKNEKVQLVANGKEGKWYDKIGEVTFSPDSRHIAYIAFIASTDKNNKIGYTDRVVLDGAEQPIESISIASDLTFSPNSERLGYLALITENKVLKIAAIVDGQVTQSFEAGDVRFLPYLHKVIFSPDSKSVAYFISSEVEGNIIIQDKIRSKNFDAFFTDYPVFSPDGKKLAYIATQTKPVYQDFVIVNNQGATGSTVVGGNSIDKPPFFTPDGKLGYIVVENTKNSKPPLHMRVVIDDKIVGDHLMTGGSYVNINTVSFSPDGKHYGYVVENTAPLDDSKENPGDTLVIDGKEFPYPGIKINPQSLVIDNKGRYAYAMTSGNCVPDKKLKTRNCNSEAFIKVGTDWSSESFNRTSDPIIRDNQLIFDGVKDHQIYQVTHKL